MRSIFALCLIVLALAGCARTETPEEARAAAARTQAEYDQGAAARAATAERESQSDARGAAGLAEGEWVFTETSRGPVAAYGAEGATTLLNVRCGEGGGLELRRPATEVPGGSLVSYVSLPEGESRLAASVDATDPAAAFLFIPPGDPFVERLIDSEGPITIRMGGARLAVPTSPALVGLVSGCGEARAAPPAAPVPAAPPPAAPAPREGR